MIEVIFHTLAWATLFGMLLKILYEVLEIKDEQARNKNE